MSHKGLLSLAVVLLLAATPLPAVCPTSDCIYVDDDCPNPPGSGTELDPYCTIQLAYDAAKLVTEPDGLDCPNTPADCKRSTILVMPGSYNECVVAWGFDVAEDRPVWLVADAWLEAGAIGPADAGFDAAVGMTVIDGSGVCDGVGNMRDAALTLGGTGAAVEGFTVTNGGRSGILAQGSVAISNNTIDGNESDAGGGIFFSTATCFYPGDTTATIDNNKVTGNLADDFDVVGLADGGGIYIAAEGSEVGNPPGCLGGISEVSVSDNIVQNNTVRNLNPGGEASGGGIWVQGVTFSPLGDPADSRTRVRISRNLVSGNAAEGAASYGGGIWANTFGYSMETIEIYDNTVGPNNSSELNGGGISGWVTALLDGRHDLRIDNNIVTENQSGFGGGLDLLMLVQLLGQDESVVLTASNNTVTDNQSVLDGAGIFAEFGNSRSADVDDGTLHPGPAAEISFTIRNNTVSDNAAGLGAGGVALLPSADNEDPDFCPGAQFPSVAHIDFESNLVTGNSADNSDPAQSGDIVGAGVLVLPTARGDARASVAISKSTIAGNTIGPNGAFVGGVELAAYTEFDCDVTNLGEGVLTVDRSIIAHNHADGIGGPPPNSDIDLNTNISFEVTKTSSFGNGDSLSFNDPDLPFEETLFPDGPPPDNLDVATDPQLDPVTFLTQVCSPAFDVGVCDSDPNTVCFDDTTCTCNPEGAGYLANPDVNVDDSIDGVDILNLAVAFGSAESENRYDAAVDLNRDGIVDGDDLMFMAPEFGEVCPP